MCISSVLSVPPAVKPKGIKRRGNKRDTAEERYGERENKRIVFIISSPQRNLITLIQPRGLIAKNGIL